MKKILLTVSMFIGLTSALLAQSPEKFNYQAVARDASGVVIANQAVSFRISILQGGSSGANVYSETHNVTTNDFGLVNMAIGTGVIASGNFPSIDWGNDIFFVQIEMDAAGGTNYQLMGSQQLVSVPYALHAETVGNDQVDDADADPNNEIQSLSISGQDLTISSGNTITLPASGVTLDEAYDFGGAGAGRTITADAGEVDIQSTVANGIGLRTTNSNTGVGVLASSTNAGNTFSTIQASTNSSSTIASAIVGNSDGAAWGVSGQVTAAATAEAAVYGSNLRTNGGHGVLGIGFNGTVGQTNYSSGIAVFGQNFDAVAPLGNGIGVAGSGYWGVVGEDMYLGAQAGAYGVYSNGNLGATGTKTFLIDHPTDPENKFLRHYSVESDEILNVYRGTESFTSNEVTVQLPDYVELVNINFSYHLTAIGGQADLYIKEELDNGQFIIAGGTPGMKVSWQVYGERNDAYIQQSEDIRNPEPLKTERQQGKYLMPHLFNQPAEKAIINTSGAKENASQTVIKIAE